MQGQGIAGERRPVYLAWIHWRGGDNGGMGGSNDTPRTGRGVGWLDDRIRFGWPLRRRWPAWLLVNSTYVHAVLSPILQIDDFSSG